VSARTQIETMQTPRRGGERAVEIVKAGCAQVSVAGGAAVAVEPLCVAWRGDGEFAERADCGVVGP